MIRRPRELARNDPLERAEMNVGPFSRGKPSAPPRTTILPVRVPVPGLEITIPVPVLDEPNDPLGPERPREAPDLAADLRLADEHGLDVRQDGARRLEPTGFC